MKQLHSRLTALISACAICLLLAAPAKADSSDHAAISNLLARYAYALDGKDAKSYAGVFMPDGILIYGGGTAQGRDTLQAMVEGLRKRELELREQDDSGLRPARGRHFLSNIVIEVDGDTATAKDYWMHLYNNNPQRTPVVTSYGHAENRLVRVDGEWFIAYRRIYNEQSEDRWVKDDNTSFVISPVD